MVDPTIKREGDGTFQIELKGRVIKSCRQVVTGPPIGHRTVIFQSLQNNDILIKEQYLCMSGSTQTEPEIITQVHLPGGTPGVVRVGDYELVTRKEDQSEAACGLAGTRRQKIRLELKDLGRPFMHIKTPKEALIAAWDLLEGDYNVCVFTCH
jgi:hypothetical protein